MLFIEKNRDSVTVDLERAVITSLKLVDAELVTAKLPLFSLRLMDGEGERQVYDASSAKTVQPDPDGAGAVYSGFPEDFSVHLRVGKEKGLCTFGLTVRNRTEKAVEWVEYPRLVLPALTGNGGKGTVLYPYNEGALVSDIRVRNASWFPCREAEYPSRGVNSVFPNMCFSQFLVYLSEGRGLYLGAEDEKRCVKYIDFTEDRGGIRFLFRIFSDTGFGEDFESGFPMVLEPFTGDWQDGAEIYRKWLLNHLPAGLKKVEEDESLPDWYRTLPLVVTYPVRGIHDMDEMSSNALFPYVNALPYLDEIREKTGAKLMALLMHWEGTAPWAPPYVWPPYGGEAMLSEFAEALHERGDLLGAYCSGFGYTVKSNLTDYDASARMKEEKAEEGFCIAPDGKTCDSTICQGQRKSYDLCVGSEKGREILNRAYAPLFTGPLDYIQILDQNHGGGQYFCYSRDHGHPPVPGKWMTETMTDFLSGWKEAAGKRVFGCESSAAEPFIPYLRFSDNRYELNYQIGEPVPLFAYLYHEYVHNFMGNQVSSGLSHQEDTMRYRMAYSFLAGDAMTLVMTPFGTLMPNWGCHDFTFSPDKEKALSFAAGMQKLLESEAGDFLMKGRMVKGTRWESESLSFGLESGGVFKTQAVLSTAWEYEGKKLQLFANHTDKAQTVTLPELHETLTLPALSGTFIRLL